MVGRSIIYILLVVACVSALLVAHNLSHFSILNNRASPWHLPVPELTAESWIFFDAENGRILREHESDNVLPIASVSKLFTAHVAFNSPALAEEVAITWGDLAQDGRAGKLEYGDRYTVRELLFPLLLESSNDAGEAIRRTIGTSAFDESITALKEKLPLPYTKIADGSGLSDENVSTARELAVFLRYMHEYERHLLDITELERYLNHAHGWVNNNPARQSEHFAGGKHGYTPEAGRTFAGFYNLSNGRSVGVVLLGSSDLAGDLARVETYLLK